MQDDGALRGDGAHGVDRRMQQVHRGYPGHLGDGFGLLQRNICLGGASPPVRIVDYDSGAHSAEVAPHLAHRHRAVQDDPHHHAILAVHQHMRPRVAGQHAAVRPGVEREMRMLQVAQREFPGTPRIHQFPQPGAHILRGRLGMQEAACERTKKEGLGQDGKSVPHET